MNSRHFQIFLKVCETGSMTRSAKELFMTQPSVSQVISELEGRRRGPYAGAVLYSLPGVALDACIAIRTIVLHEGVALLQAGAGIVADSDPTAEHEECLRKLAALEAAIDHAEGG